MLSLSERERRCPVEHALLLAELFEVSRPLRIVFGIVHDDVAARASFLRSSREVRVITLALRRRGRDSRGKIDRTPRIPLGARTLQGSDI